MDYSRLSVPKAHNRGPSDTCEMSETEQVYRFLVSLIVAHGYQQRTTAELKVNKA